MPDSDPSYITSVPNCLQGNRELNICSRASCCCPPRNASHVPCFSYPDPRQPAEMPSAVGVQSGLGQRGLQLSKADFAPLHPDMSRTLRTIQVPQAHRQPKPSEKPTRSRTHRLQKVRGSSVLVNLYLSSSLRQTVQLPPSHAEHSPLTTGTALLCRQAPNSPTSGPKPKTARA